MNSSPRRDSQSQNQNDLGYEVFRSLSLLPQGRGGEEGVSDSIWFGAHCSKEYVEIIFLSSLEIGWFSYNLWPLSLCKPVPCPMREQHAGSSHWVHASLPSPLKCPAGQHVLTAQSASVISLKFVTQNCTTDHLESLSYFSEMWHSTERIMCRENVPLGQRCYFSQCLLSKGSPFISAIELFLVP